MSHRRTHQMSGFILGYSVWVPDNDIPEHSGMRKKFVVMRKPPPGIEPETANVF